MTVNLRVLFPMLYLQPDWLVEEARNRAFARRMLNEWEIPTRNPATFEEFLAVEGLYAEEFDFDPTPRE